MGSEAPHEGGLQSRRSSRSSVIFVGLLTPSESVAAGRERVENQTATVKDARDRSAPPGTSRVIEELVGIDHGDEDAGAVAPKPSGGDTVGSNEERRPALWGAEEFGQLIQTKLHAAAVVMAAGMVIPGYVWVGAGLKGRSSGPIAAPMAATRSEGMLAEEWKTSSTPRSL